MNYPLPALHVLAKPTGAACNLNCTYCFFLSKESLYPGESSRMSDETMESYIRQLLEPQDATEVTIAWQGGEPTLMGLDFFRRSMDVVERHRKPGQQILHTLQTNGVLLNDEWCTFLKEHGFLVGLSMDGPQKMHDAYRVTKSGIGTFDKVVHAWEILQRHQVEVNILCTVHAANADYPLDVYRFFRDELKANYLQFIPIVERATSEMLSLANQGWGEPVGADRPLYTQSGAHVTERSVGAEQFGRFMIAIFDEWVRRDVGRVFLQTFDATLASFIGQHSLCIFSPTCGNAVCLEHNGDLYSCDHYVEPGYMLGNIKRKPMYDLAASKQQQEFGRVKLASLPKYCRECEVLFACHGECPRNRFITTPDGEEGLNYLCEGYKLFFTHVKKPMMIMADLIRQGRYADEIMQMVAAPVRDREEVKTMPSRTQDKVTFSSVMKG
jgi:uncharacterized protein